MLTKPCLPDELLTKLQQLFERASALRGRAERAQSEARSQLARAEDVVTKVNEWLPQRITLKKAQHHPSASCPAKRRVSVL